MQPERGWIHESDGWELALAFRFLHMHPNGLFNARVQGGRHVVGPALLEDLDGLPCRVDDNVAARTTLSVLLDLRTERDVELIVEVIGELG